MFLSLSRNRSKATLVTMSRLLSASRSVSISSDGDGMMAHDASSLKSFKSLALIGRSFEFRMTLGYECTYT